MRKADVAVGDCARLAATVSLVLAAAKIRDHVDDGDGALGRPGVRGAATALATRWAAASARSGQRLGFEVGVLTEAVGRQAVVEAAAGPGTDLLTVTEPTEIATAAAFAHTAVLAGKPANAEPLREAGRLFGRIAHLVDAVEDLAADRASGAWNPLLATGADLAEARRLCDDALLGIKLALGEAEFRDARLVHTLLVHELARSVHRVLGHAGGTAAPRARRHGHGHAGAGGQAGAVLAGCGLPVAGAALTGLFSLRHRRRCGCCGACREACPEACCEACGEGCCSSCDCSC
jgi:hypothetical protein